ncbi:PhzF family phenazine biosynthesis protein [Nonomuraea sp. NPDC050691]|uniref:PhzF family phenazine biosynthesis protein n=1 Tax=Nonomuraea sp. NPDC050691 TaxID=3155661 RepID=UPI0033ECA88A
MHETARLSQPAWDALRVHYQDEQLLELLVLAGWYRTVGYLANGLLLEDEPWAVPFPEAPQPPRPARAERDAGRERRRAATARGSRSPVATRSALAALDPDLDRLRAACDRLGLLGCYVYSVPERSGRVAARMFAPSIGVPEDVANANGTACLAAHLAGQGFTGIAVDMGDSLGSPSTIAAAPRDLVVRLGGAARIARVLHLP